MRYVLKSCCLDSFVTARLHITTTTLLHTINVPVGACILHALVLAITIPPQHQLLAQQL
jgi:hypothetical protein